jgi:hypothetical protein
MGCSLRARVGTGIVLSLTLLLAAGTGCQSQTVSAAKLAHQQRTLNTTGLKDVENYQVVKARAAAPRAWEQLNIKKTSLFTDMQWRSPSKLTGVGIAYIRLPLPLPAGALIWFAKQEYTKKSNDGKLLSEWTDAIGRPWFEAENNKYHVKGYIVTKGFEAWIVYSGYKVATPPSDEELKLAHRAQETIVPTPLSPNMAQTPMSTAE